MEDNSKHTIALHLNYLGRQNNLIIKTTLEMKKKTETSMEDHKADNKPEKQIR